MKQPMKIGSYWLLIAILAVATATVAPSSGFAQGNRPLQGPVPGVGIPAPVMPAPPLGATVPNVGPANSDSESSAGEIVPPTAVHRETLADCIGYWDAGTHMSKAEWRRACQRTLNGTDLGEPQ